MLHVSGSMHFFTDFGRLLQKFHGSTQRRLRRFFFAASCCAACQCARSSLLNSAERSSGKKILASLNSTRRRVPGMVSASQCDHFTSKYTSSVPQTIRIFFPEERSAEF